MFCLKCANDKPSGMLHHIGSALLEAKFVKFHKLTAYAPTCIDLKFFKITVIMVYKLLLTYDCYCPSLRPFSPFLQLF